MDIKKIAEELRKEQSEKNWKELRKALKDSKIRHYKTVYSKGKLAKKEDLRTAYVELYDAKEIEIARIPIFKKERGKIRGATIYLKGLTNINKQ